MDILKRQSGLLKQGTQAFEISLQAISRWAKGKPESWCLPERGTLCPERRCYQELLRLPVREDRLGQCWAEPRLLGYDHLSSFRLQSTLVSEPCRRTWQREGRRRGDVTESFLSLSPAWPSWICFLLLPVCLVGLLRITGLIWLPGAIQSQASTTPVNTRFC